MLLCRLLTISLIVIFPLYALSADQIRPSYIPDKLFLNDVNFPPYLFPDGSGNPPGIAKELITSCLDGYEVELIYQTLPIKRTEVFMRSGAIDLTVYSYKPSREEFVVYAKEPLFNSEYGFVVAANSGISISSLSDLEPYVIGHLSGLSHTPELLSLINKKRDRHEVVESYNIDSTFQQLLSSPPRIDIAPNSKSTFLWRARSLGVQDRVRVLDFVVTEKEYFITVSKHSLNVPDPEVFAGYMDSCVRALKQSGKYQEIVHRYR